MGKITITGLYFSISHCQIPTILPWLADMLPPLWSPFSSPSPCDGSFLLIHFWSVVLQILCVEPAF